MSETLDAPVLVLADFDGALPTGPALELVTAARTLTAGDVVALVLGPVEAAASAARVRASASASRSVKDTMSSAVRSPSGTRRPPPAATQSVALSLCSPLPMGSGT